MELVNGFLDIMTRGGPVMWPIFITAWLAIIMLVERALRLTTWLRVALQDQSGFDRDAGYWPVTASAAAGSPIGQLLARIDRSQIRTHTDLAKQLNVHLAELMPRLEGVLPTVAILGTLLPMLGLLGTVIGMIDVFETIALHGTGKPEEMASGISQALLTTATGLITAIPIIFAHHLLVRRLRLLLAVTEQSMLVVYHRGLSPAGERP